MLESREMRAHTFGSCVTPRLRLRFTNASATPLRTAVHSRKLVVG